jgi:hypothetical protein
VLYEDIPVTIPAHFLASAVDVVNEPVYYWRQREGDDLDRVDAGILDELPAILRLKWYLVGRGLLPEVLKVLESERLGGRIPVARRLYRRYAKYPFWRDRLRIPRRIFRIRDEMRMHTRLHEVSWRNGKLHVAGHAYVDYVGVPWPWSAVKVIGVREERSGRTRLLPALPRRCPDATVDSRQVRYSYDWSGFSFTLDPKKLRRGGRYQDGTWLVAAGVYGRGVLRRDGGPLLPGHLCRHRSGERGVHRPDPTARPARRPYRARVPRRIRGRYRLADRHGVRCRPGRR